MSETVGPVAHHEAILAKALHDLKVARNREFLESGRLETKVEELVRAVGVSVDQDESMESIMDKCIKEARRTRERYTDSLWNR